MQTPSFSEFLSSVAERGMAIVGISRLSRRDVGAADVVELCHMLLSNRGEAAGIALSLEILLRYRQLAEEEKTAFFLSICDAFSVDDDRVAEAANAYLDAPSPDSLTQLADTVEPARQELFRRLNQAPDATKTLVDMRADLLERLATHPELKIVDRDFTHLFTSWFNRGFLELRRIDWRTSAALLEKIIKYEAVHGMSGWEELRERIDPPDRHIYGFFHPRLGDEPLIFVEVALMNEMPPAIGEILAKDRSIVEPDTAKVAVFYSISNCQRGLRGVPLGNFLIKQVVEDLRTRFAALRDFVTLSPAPALGRWLRSSIAEGTVNLSTETCSVLAEGANANWPDNGEASHQLSRELMPAAAWFLLNGTSGDGRPIDPVARFHLGNGARLERLNWAADLSAGGLETAAGVMVNYRYKLDEIERNHEGFANSGVIRASSAVERLAKEFDSKVRDARPAAALTQTAGGENGGESAAA